MADVPVDRTFAVPLFSSVGLAVFRHWIVSCGRATRKNAPLQKYWAVIFTCLASQAVHVEILPSMDTSTIVYALKRFSALRGPCQSIISDRCSNFIGARRQASDIDGLKIGKCLTDSRISWKFNSPCSSHFGGVWERKIGQIRRCLDATFLHAGERALTLDELSTLLQEAAAVVNSTPL